jgi:hypothetical protein
VELVSVREQGTQCDDSGVEGGAALADGGEKAV